MSLLDPEGKQERMVGRIPEQEEVRPRRGFENL